MTMGAWIDEENPSEDEFRAFTRTVLGELEALEALLETDAFVCAPRHIGAEQEVFLVDEHCRPATVATELLPKLEDPRFTTELALYNLEANLDPIPFSGACLAELERALQGAVDRLAEVGKALRIRPALVGILPTLKHAHLGPAHMTPIPRYRALDRAVRALRGERFRVYVRGADTLDVDADSVMFEAANTSFQLHYQVKPSEFARVYNVAQMVTAPLLALATNSPVLFGRRLWRETRVALFEHAVDARSRARSARGNLSRVSFGDRWVEDSVVELFRDNIARFRALLYCRADGDAKAEVARGKTPSLSSLCLHNGTVWRWNRPCYGVSAAGPHLRIENRVLPSGPTIIDEVANAAFLFGLLHALPDRWPDLKDRVPFEHARGNFVAASREGLRAKFNWFGQRVAAEDLIREVLIPAAEEGLSRAEIDRADITRSMDILRERLESGQTGAEWLLAGTTAASMSTKLRGSSDRAMTSAFLARQASGAPVHQWAPITQEELEARVRTIAPESLTAEDLMSTDLLTLRPCDPLEVAERIMAWRQVRHIPVETDEGQVAGLLTSPLEALVAQLSTRRRGRQAPLTVGDLMQPATHVDIDIPLHRVKQELAQASGGCLLVVYKNRLVGLITDKDLPKGS